MLKVTLVPICAFDSFLMEGFQGVCSTHILPPPTALSKSSGSKMLHASLHGEDCPVKIRAVRYIKYKKEKKEKKKAKEAHRGEHMKICRCGHAVDGEKEGSGLCPTQHLLWPWESLQQR